jgi:hypothetical protein
MNGDQNTIIFPTRLVYAPSDRVCKLSFNEVVNKVAKKNRETKDKSARILPEKVSLKL